jgi:CheY-like chemotaxis protein
MRGLFVAAKHPVLEVLLAEGNTDNGLTLETLADGDLEMNLHVVRDGVEATAFLRKEGAYRDSARPALILLDLNLPGKGGRELLAELKLDPDLRRIPVVAFSASETDDADAQTAYRLRANCYITKPIDAPQMAIAVKLIKEFWLSRVRLPAV